MSKKRDWSAVKFEVAEILGDWMNCLYFNYSLETETFDWKFRHHTKHDGMSGITHILKEEGFQMDSQPQMLIKKRPFLPSRLKKLYEFIQLTKNSQHKWKNRTNAVGISEGFSLAFFSKEQTDQIKKAAKDHKVALNSFLLKSLDDVIAQELLFPDQLRKWVCPINMRGGVTHKPIEYGNYSASIILNIAPNDQLEDVHLQLKNYLKKGVQWGSWIYTNMAKFIGMRGTVWVARKIRDVGTGVFSNLGEWPLPEMTPPASTQYNQNSSFGAVAPASSVLPVSAAAAIWHGKLTLSIHIHCSLEVNLKETESLMKKWSHKIQEKLETHQDPLVKSHLWENFQESKDFRTSL